MLEIDKKDISLLKWLAVLVFFEFFALYFIQKSNESGENKNYIILSCLLYGLPVALLLSKLVEFKNIGVVNFMWNVASTLSGFFIAMYLFNYKVNNLEWLGVGLGILSLGLIIMGGSQSGSKEKSNL